MSREIVTNRKARRDFEILETLEAGISLLGTEVKSIRQGKVDLLGAFVRLERGEAFLYDATIQVYEQASHETHEPTRRRRLLLHHSEIARLSAEIAQKGRALPALRMYWHHGKVKLEIGVGKGRNAGDKRHLLKKRAVDRDVDREIARFERKH